MKKIICVFLLLAMVLALLPGEILAMNVSGPAMSVTSTKYFTALPVCMKWVTAMP